MGIKIETLKDKINHENDLVEVSLTKCRAHCSRNNIAYDDEELTKCVKSLAGQRVYSWAHARNIDIDGTYSVLMQTFFKDWMKNKDCITEHYRSILQASGIMSIRTKQLENEFIDTTTSSDSMSLDKVKKMLEQLKDAIVEDSSGTKYQIKDLQFRLELVSKMSGVIKI